MSNSYVKYGLTTGLSVSIASKWDTIAADPQPFIGTAILFIVLYFTFRPLFKKEPMPESECRELVLVSNPSADEGLDQSVAFRLGKALKRIWRGKRIGPAPAAGNDPR